MPWKPTNIGTEMQETGENEIMLSLRHIKEAFVAIKVWEPDSSVCLWWSVIITQTIITPDTTGFHHFHYEITEKNIVQYWISHGQSGSISLFAVSPHMSLMCYNSTWQSRAVYSAEITPDYMEHRQVSSLQSGVQFYSQSHVQQTARTSSVNTNNGPVTLIFKETEMSLPSCICQEYKSYMPLEVFCGHNGCMSLCHILNWGLRLHIYIYVRLQLHGFMPVKCCTKTIMVILSS